MPMEFIPLSDPYLDAARAFNQRMRDAAALTDFLLPENCGPGSHGDAQIRWTNYIAWDGNQIRGGVIEVDQPAWLGDHAVRAFNYQSPLSEGIVNRKYATVGAQLVKFCERDGHLAFVEGMGSESRPLPRLLNSAGWSIRAVPFLFRIHRAGAVLRELQVLNSSPVRRLAARAAAATGLGTLAVWLLHSRRRPQQTSLRQVAGWGEWADEIWERFRAHCSFAVLRDRRTLAELYPQSDPRLHIFLVERDGRPAGWAVCFDTWAGGHVHLRPHFGRLRVGSILDCAAAPEDMRATAMLVDRELQRRGVDLVVSNQSHGLWIQSFRSAGFLSGPSNFLLATSKTLTHAIQAQANGESQVHVSRGDGAGRLGLG